MPISRVGRWRSGLACCVLAVAWSSTHAAQAHRTRLDETHAFDIAPQSLSTALAAFARQAQLHLVTSNAQLDDAAPGVHGELSAAQALAQLLRGSGLSFKVSGENTVAIRPAKRGNTARHDARSPEHAVAEPAHALALAEVLVTARKREETAHSAPLALTAFTAEALRERNVDSIEQIAPYVPNLQFDGAAPISGGSFNATLFIRGMGQNDFATFTDPGVGLYVDGVYLGRTIGSTLLAFDLARIEVLRGPQGTVFGRNTIGGAISIISQAPEAAPQLDVNATAGSYRRRDAQAIINVPLFDGRVLNRLSVARSRRDGYARQIDYVTGDVQQRGDQNALAARWQTLWRMTDALDLTLRLDDTDIDQHAAPLTLVRVGDPSRSPLLSVFNAQVAPQLPIPPRNGVVGVGNQWLTDDPYTTYGNYGNYNRLHNWGTGVTLAWRVTDMQLKSITAYRHLRADFARDGDNTPYPYRETSNHDLQSQWSQELQVAATTVDGRLDWLAGGYYFKENATDDASVRLADGVYNITQILGQDLSVTAHNVTRNESYALFAQAIYRWNAHWSVTPSARLTHDRKEFSGWQYRMQAHSYIVPPGFRKQASWNQFTPKLSVDYQPDDDALLYAAVAKGYKSGGFNGRTLGDANGINEYSPEKVWSYELGAKTRWFERRLTINTALFYNRYEDIQLAVNATPYNFVSNAAAGRVWGAELETTARVAPELDLNIAAGYLNARYTRILPCSSLGSANPQCLPITLNSRFVRAPEWTLSVGAQHVSRFSAGLLTVRADWNYRSFTYQDVGNDAAIAQPAYGVLNARAAWATHARWDLALFGTNLGNTRYRVSGNAASPVLGGLAESTYAPRREWGVTAGYRFF